MAQQNKTSLDLPVSKLKTTSLLNTNLYIQIGQLIYLRAMLQKYIDTKQHQLCFDNKKLFALNLKINWALQKLLNDKNDASYQVIDVRNHSSKIEFTLQRGQIKFTIALDKIWNSRLRLKKKTTNYLFPYQCIGKIFSKAHHSKLLSLVREYLSAKSSNDIYLAKLASNDTV